MSCWRSSGSANGGRSSGGRWTLRTWGPALAVSQGGLTVFGHEYFIIIIIIILFFINDFLREGRLVCKVCTLVKWWCAMSEGDTIKMSQKKTGCGGGE